MLNRAVDAIHRGSDLLALVAGLMFLALLGLTTYDALARNVFESPTAAGVEYGTVLLPILAYLGLGYVQKFDGHISVDLIVSRLPSRIGRSFRRTAYVASLLVVGVLVIASIAVALRSVQAGEIMRGVISVPLWPARLAVALGFLFLWLELMVSLFARPPEEAEEAGAFI